MSEIVIRNARLHNLKNITVTIPKNKLVVFTGISGSGKSSLGFDILHKEGQRQYLESLGMVGFEVSKPPVDGISGLSPSISVDQHLTNNSPRSTVGTSSDVYTYLRVLFARLGHRPCPVCGYDIPPGFAIEDEEWDGETNIEGDASVQDEFFACPYCSAQAPKLSMAHFSFNKPEGACPTCTGLGIIHQVNMDRLIDESKSITEGGIIGWDAQYASYHLSTLKNAAAYYGIEFKPSQPIKYFSPILRDLLFYGVESSIFKRHFPDKEPPATVRNGRFEGLATNLLRRYSERIQDIDYVEKLDDFLIKLTCPDCHGSRLREESRVVTVKGKSIVFVAKLTLIELNDWLKSLSSQLDSQEMLIADPVLEELRGRNERLIEVGAGYLALERSSPSLSAGESQRLRLAALLGSGLTGVLYVLDEPTIGTHQRDTRRLIGVLRKLRDLGNTVLVIEHDLEMILAADYVFDFGPGAGKHGGQVVASGSPGEIVNSPGSITGDYLARRLEIPMPEKRRVSSGKAITVFGARQHNLKNITVRFPLGMLVAVTGVSGSGKSSLVFDILDCAVRRQLNQGIDEVGEHDRIEGSEHIDKVITIDQAHIGRIPRSNAATYADIFTPIREAFAATPESRQLGFSASHFSFNVPGGRCERCKGAGVLSVKMHFLPDVEVRCPVCHGKRFTQRTLGVHYHGHDISQVLEMTVEEALDVFQEIPSAVSRLKLLEEVGLGYLKMGQPATTLSGGEAQRVKLAKELGRRTKGRILYLLDEPTTGLHLADTACLLAVLQKLVNAGNSVILVEHNLELVKAADWVIDLGPEGGNEGGRVVAEGTPEQLARIPVSVTGFCLNQILVQEGKL